MPTEMKINPPAAPVATVLRVSLLIVSVITYVLVMSNSNYGWQNVDADRTLDSNRIGIQKSIEPSLSPYEQVMFTTLNSAGSHYHPPRFVHSIAPMSTLSNAFQCLKMGKRIAYSIKYCETQLLTPPHSHIPPIFSPQANYNFCQLVIQNPSNALQYKDLYVNQINAFAYNIAAQNSAPLAYASTNNRITAVSAPSPSFALADCTNVNVDQPSKKGKTGPTSDASNNELEEALLHLFNSSEHLSVYTSCQLHHYNEAMRKSLSRFLQRPEMARLNYIHQNWDGNNETLRSEAKTIITNHFSPTVVSCTSCVVACTSIH